MKNNTFIKLKPKNDNQRLYLHSLQTNKITFCERPSGVGKTFLATLKGIEELLNNKYHKLIISRPLVQSGENSGFIPGDINDKLDPYLRPIYDILEYTFSYNDLNKLKEQKQIEVIPFGYMRGRNFRDSFIILDEVQNCSYNQLVLALTRFAENSKMVLTGDAAQSDLPITVQGGFSKIMSKLHDTKSIGIVKLTLEDIVREPIVKTILEKLNET